MVGILGGLVGQAAVTKPVNNIGFSVGAKLPTNQQNKRESFFDLAMKPGKQQVLKTVIYNVTNRDIQVQTAIHTAYTNSNGVIEYVVPTKTLDASLRYPMHQVTKLQSAKVVTVPANGNKTVTAKVKMPQSQFSGVILGGWFFKRVNQKATSTVKNSMNIRNQYSYVIGLKYTEDKPPAPNLKLGKVTAGMENYHRGVFPELRNIAAVIVPNLTVKSTVTSKQAGRVVHQARKKNVQLAPNSRFRYPLLTGTKPLQAGDYHLHLVATNAAHHWIFDRDFTISPAAAKRYNQQSVDNAGLSIWWFVGAGALGTLVVVGSAWLIRNWHRRRTI
ncbi:DUF916 and DUF3324 domain-containing protein [Lactiplantibacillus daowaiensis]|uniref:DUF916 and DUF3324 domain-containing protein n=1 Tax=Lactiplantibacillus daowaiensis TaxID=2559918 RepID=A0ABW1S1V3_9LACO|nr:DUF916 and DUF3324 domain-containing protein [Lactiplantibacillus daowaiensis]